VELTVIHHEGLVAPVTGGTLAEERIMMAGQFLAEAISPFEMTLRSYQANARLLGLSEILARQNAESDRAYEQLRTILDATTAIIYLKDMEGHYLFVNRQFENAFGLQRKQAIGKRDEEILPKSVADVLWENDQCALTKHSPEELEEILSTGEESSRTYLSLKYPLADANGHCYAICSVSTDITERKLADQELRRAKEATEAANRELESFSYSVAHDLRAPLRSINAFAQILLEECADRLDAEGKENLQIVLESAQDMTRLIESLLTLSRLSRGSLRKERICLSALVHTIADRLQKLEPARRVEFVIQEDLIEEADTQLMAAALENLIGNAWKFTGKQATARIEFGVESGETPRTYFVRDDGAGFDMSQVERLFGVFQRLHSTDDFEGTGIGLATVQRIVRRHGGRVWARGEENRGATFYFMLQEEPMG
jgi:PAS domain S-box-containing protein